MDMMEDMPAMWIIMVMTVLLVCVCCCLCILILYVRVSRRETKEIKNKFHDTLSELERIKAVNIAPHVPSDDIDAAGDGDAQNVQYLGTEQVAIQSQDEHPRNEDNIPRNETTLTNAFSATSATSASSSTGSDSEETDYTYTVTVTAATSDSNLSPKQTAIKHVHPQPLDTIGLAKDAGITDQESWNKRMVELQTILKEQYGEQLPLQQIQSQHVDSEYKD